MSLGEHISRLIAAEGPITVERYMALCLDAYYGGRDPLGAAGDFTTAPEISQMFGELLGLWAATVWRGMGSPEGLRLVELGPGRGTLMADALRALRGVPGFLKAATVHLVETSPVLRGRQARVLAEASVSVTWHEALVDVPGGPAIVLANEFFDALPIRQFVGTENGWCERVISSDGGVLRFGVRAQPEPAVREPLRAGAILERPEIGAGIARGLCERLARQGGAALIVDYGYWGGGVIDTLQAVRSHAYTDPLAAPGEADLTAQVDFCALASAAAAGGAAIQGPSSQGDFLRALGIEQRAATLRAGAAPAQAAAVESGLRRLIDPAAMGDLFKVCAFSHPSLAELPGLRPNPMAGRQGG